MERIEIEPLGSRRIASALPRLSIAALLLLTPAAAWAGGGKGSPDTLPTGFSLLIGSPDPADPGSQGVLLVPGTVLPLSSEKVRDPQELQKDLMARGTVIAGLHEKLRQTLRLGDLKVQYQVVEPLALDRARDLPSPVPLSRLGIQVTLLGYNPTLATYRVVFTDGGRRLADTSVSVPRGQRAVVGGLDGEEAPYLFLVIEPAAASAGPLRVDEAAGITPPRAIEKVAPKYPAEARKEKVEGVVILQAVISDRGVVEEVKVLKSAHPALDQAAMEAVQAWRWEPAFLDGKPVSVYYNLTINFRLSEEAPDKE